MFVDHPMAKIKVLNEEATKKTCKGCKRADSHIEDPTYSSIVGAFPFDVVASMQPRDSSGFPVTEAAAAATPGAPASTPGEAASPLRAVSPPQEYFIHKVTSFDTLEGLAIRYGVPVRA